jgi:hypothetical protein
MAYPTIAEALRGVRGVYLSDDRFYPSRWAFAASAARATTATACWCSSTGMPTNDNWINSSYIGYDARTDLDDVERIEVVRGPGSVLYGTGAFSGVVNIVTRGATCGASTASRRVASRGASGTAPSRRNGCSTLATRASLRGATTPSRAIPATGPPTRAACLSCASSPSSRGGFSSCRGPSSTTTATARRWSTATRPTPWGATPSTAPGWAASCASPCASPTACGSTWAARCSATSRCTSARARPKTARRISTPPRPTRSSRATSLPTGPAGGGHRATLRRGRAQAHGRQRLPRAEHLRALLQRRRTDAGALPGGLRPETIWSGEVEFSHRFGSHRTGARQGYANYIDNLIALRESRPWADAHRSTRTPARRCSPSAARPSCAGSGARAGW